MTSRVRQATLETSLGLLLAVGAVDASQLSPSWTAEVLLIGASVLTALMAISSGVLSRASLAATPVRWYLMWLAWAAGTAIFAPGGPEPILYVAHYTVIIAGVICVFGVGGEIGLARTAIIGFVAFVGLSLVAAFTQLGPELARDGDRLALLSLEANQLVRIAGIAFLACLYMATMGLRAGSRSQVGVGAIVGLGALVAIYLGDSRTGTVALAAAFATFAVSVAPRHVRPAIALSGVAIAVGALVLAVNVAGGLLELGEVVETSISRDPAQVESEISSLNGRLQIWPEVLGEVAEQPIGGHGLGNDRTVLAGLWADGRLGWPAQHTHNLALQVLLTTGIVGLALLGSGIIATLARALSAEHPFGSSILVLVLVDGISEAAIRVPSFGWFALCGAAALTAGRQLPQS